jgi:hypothetical protein
LRCCGSKAAVTASRPRRRPTEPPRGSKVFRGQPHEPRPVSAHGRNERRTPLRSKNPLWCALPVPGHAEREMPHPRRRQPRRAPWRCERPVCRRLLDLRSHRRTPVYSHAVEGHLGKDVLSYTKNLPTASRAPRRSPPARVKITGIQGNVATFGSPGPAHDVWRKQLKAALGTVSDAFVDMSLQHLMRAARMPASELAVNGGACSYRLVCSEERTGRGFGSPERLHAHGGDGDVRPDRRRPWRASSSPRAGVYGRQAATSILHADRDVPPLARWRRPEHPCGTRSCP